MKFIMLIFSLFIILFFNVISTKAYTEEQKQQAKAWLSAHGYAPTKAGAYQAYADYKSGKLKLDNSKKKVYKKKSSKSKKSTNRNNNKTINDSIKKHTPPPISSQSKGNEKSKDIVPPTPIETAVSETPVATKSVKVDSSTEKEREGGSFSKHIYMGGMVIIVLTIIMFVCIRKTRKSI